MACNQSSTDNITDSASVTIESETEIKSLLFAIDDWKPLICSDEKDYGPLPILVKIVFENEGYEVEFEFTNWNRAIVQTEEAVAFGTFPWGETEERYDKFIFSDPLINSMDSWIYLADNENIPDDLNNISELKNLKIGAIDNYSSTAILRELGIEYESTINEYDLIKKVYNGHIDLFINHPGVMLNQIEEIYPLEVDKFEISEFPFREFTHHLIISKSYPNGEALMELFNKGLRELIENGTYQEVMEQYGVFEGVMID